MSCHMAFHAAQHLLQLVSAPVTFLDSSKQTHAARLRAVEVSSMQALKRPSDAQPHLLQDRSILLFSDTVCAEVNSSE